MFNTDFWWLSPEETTHYSYIDLFHQEPYSDEPDTDKEPLSSPMLQGERRYPLEFITQWKAKFRSINVFRSLALYASDTNGKKIIGPFLLDIDRTLEKDGGHVPDLGKALIDTRLLVEKYCSNLGDDDYRIFFTGHKGFHIEIQPKAISTASNVDRWQHFENSRKDINRQFGDAFIDRFHHHVRLHDSINSWVDYSGRSVNSMNFEVSTDELFSLRAKDMSAKAENLALGALKL